MNIMNQFIELCCYVYALYFFSGIKLTKSIWKYGISFLTIIVIGIWFEKLGNEDMVLVWLFVQMVCLYSFISEPKRKKIIFSIGTITIVGFMNALVAMGLIILNIKTHTLDYSLCICLVALLIVGILVKISKKRVSYPKLSLLNYVLAILMAILMTGLLMCEVTYLQSIGKRGGTVTTVIVISIIIIIVIMVIVLFMSELSLKQSKERNILMEKYLEIQEKYYISVCDNYDSIRRFEHDIKKHFNHIKYIMEEKRYEETKDYVEQLSDQFYSATREVYTCSNYTISAILNQLKPWIEAENIQFDFIYNVVHIITIKSVDLSIVLYNLVHNAIEACEKVEKEKRKVTLGFYEYESTLFIKISNSVGQKVKEQGIKKFETSKDDSENHGFGLMNVNAVVEKYNGQIKYKCEESFFYVEILFLDAIDR